MDEYSEEKTILELTKYYVERYQLNTEYYSNSNEEKEDGLGAYKQAITRLIKDTSFCGRSLWNIIKKEDCHSVRKISIDDFEEQCFGRWYLYIQKQKTYNKTMLDDDYNKVMARTKKKIWDKRIEERIEERIEAHNQAFEEYQQDLIDNVDIYEVSNEKIKEKGLEIMIEAIYDVFYEPFNWGLLESDMNNIQSLSDGYNPSINSDTLQSELNLNNARAVYVGRRRIMK